MSDKKRKTYPSEIQRKKDRYRLDPEFRKKCLDRTNEYRKRMYETNPVVKEIYRLNCLVYNCKESIENDKKKLKYHKNKLIRLLHQREELQVQRWEQKAEKKKAKECPSFPGISNTPKVTNPRQVSGNGVHMQQSPES